jgi:hypothetical protein
LRAILFNRKNIIAFIFILVTLSACSDNPKDGTMGSKNIMEYGETNVETIKYDGCEYLIFYNPRYTARYAVVHKGNCRNQIHQQSRVK